VITASLVITMAKRPVVLGPWRGGLNLKDDPQLIRDNELVDALNVVIKADGTITNRPGMQAISPADIGTTIGANERLDVLGIIDDRDYIVGKAVRTSNEWSTTNIYKGTLDSDISSSGITWSDTGFNPSAAGVFGSEKLGTEATYEAGLGTAVAKSGCAVALNTTAGNSRTGTNSLKVTATSTISVAYAAVGSAGTYLTVVGGRDYTLTAYCKPVTRATPVTIELEWYTSGGTLISISNSQGQITAAINVFTALTLSTPAPSNAAYVKVAVFASSQISGDIIYWDDFSFKEGSKPHYVKTFKYLDSLYLLPSVGYHRGAKSVGAVATYTNLGYFDLPTGLYYFPSTGLSNRPTTDLAFVWKDRLFICYDDIVYYSKATDLTEWSTAPGLGGFFYVGSDATGDSSFISSAVLAGDALHIFKTKSTYAFTFQTDPGTDGYLKVVSNSRGSASAVEWNGRIFTCDSESVYEYVSGQFIDIGYRLNLVSGFNGGWYTMQSGPVSVNTALHIMDNYLVVGPLIRKLGSAWSGKYFAMSLSNGAWSTWVVYGSFFHSVDAGDTDTVDCQGFVDTTVAPQHGLYHLGNSEQGNQLIFMNFREDSNEVTDGLSTAQRLPRYYVETKMLTFNNEVQFKKVYRVQFNRNLGISDGGISTTFAKGGFGVRYIKPADLQVSSTTATRVQSLLTDHFGDLRAGSTFRCLSFSAFYEYYYVNQQSITIDDATKKYRFKINGIIAHVDLKADFSNVQTLAVT
jgi:hypothetical protein